MDSFVTFYGLFIIHVAMEEFYDSIFPDIKATVCWVLKPIWTKQRRLVCYPFVVINLHLTSWSSG